jgi:hypothetical protein
VQVTYFVFSDTLRSAERVKANAEVTQSRIRVSQPLHHLIPNYLGLKITDPVFLVEGGGDGKCGNRFRHSWRSLVSLNFSFPRVLNLYVCVLANNQKALGIKFGT